MPGQQKKYTPNKLLLSSNEYLHQRLEDREFFHDRPNLYGDNNNLLNNNECDEFSDEELDYYNQKMNDTDNIRRMWTMDQTTGKATRYQPHGNQYLPKGSKSREGSLLLTPRSYEDKLWLQEQDSFGNPHHDTNDFSELIRQRAEALALEDYEKFVKDAKKKIIRKKRFVNKLASMYVKKAKDMRKKKKSPSFKKKHTSHEEKDDIFDKTNSSFLKEKSQMGPREDDQVMVQTNIIRKKKKKKRSKPSNQKYVTYQTTRSFHLREEYNHLGDTDLHVPTAKHTKFFHGKHENAKPIQAMPRRMSHHVSHPQTKPDYSPWNSRLPQPDSPKRMTNEQDLYETYNLMYEHKNVVTNPHSRLENTVVDPRKRKNQRSPAQKKVNLFVDTSPEPKFQNYLPVSHSPMLAHDDPPVKRVKPKQKKKKKSIVAQLETVNKKKTKTKKKKKSKKTIIVKKKKKKQKRGMSRAEYATKLMSPLQVNDPTLFSKASLLDAKFRSPHEKNTIEMEEYQYKPIESPMTPTESGNDVISAFENSMRRQSIVRSNQQNMHMNGEELNDDDFDEAANYFAAQLDDDGTLSPATQLENRHKSPLILKN